MEAKARRLTVLNKTGVVLGNQIFHCGRAKYTNPQKSVCGCCNKSEVITGSLLQNEAMLREAKAVYLWDELTCMMSKRPFGVWPNGLNVYLQGIIVLGSVGSI